MSLADEDELEVLLIAEIDMAPLHQILIEIDWNKPWTLLQTNNSTAAGVTNNKIVIRQTKLMDMR